MTVISIVSLFDIALGLFLLFPLLWTVRQKKANIWLVIFLVALISTSIADVLYSSKLYLEYPQLAGWFDWPIWSLGFSYYFYARSLLGFKLQKYYWLHFIPLILGVSLQFYLAISIPKELVLKSLQEDYAKPPGMNGFIALAQAYLVFYLIAVFRLIYRYRKQLQQEYSNLKDKDFKWLFYLTLANLVVFIFWVPAPFYGCWGVALLDITQVMITYLIAWFGFTQKEVFVRPYESSILAPKVEVSQSEVVGIVDNASKPSGLSVEKYAKSGMTRSIAKLIGERMQKQINERKIHLNPDLNLSQLAVLIGTSPQLVSQYLNEEEGVNFFDFINEKRVKAVQEQLKSGENDQTLLDIAFACGFNSKSTFITAFKKYTGKSPSEWRKSLNLENKEYEPIG